MIKVSVEEIKKLRKLTQGGVMDCRQALIEAKGDFKKAKEILKKRGLAKVEKGRKLKAGLVASYTHATGRIGALVALGCETDFVSRTEEFRKLAHELCLQVASMNPKDVRELLSQEYIRQPGVKVEDLLKEYVGKFGENIKIEGFERMEI
jgi:elongation factor Ts